MQHLSAAHAVWVVLLCSQHACNGSLPTLENLSPVTQPESRECFPRDSDLKRGRPSFPWESKAKKIKTCGEAERKLGGTGSWVAFQQLLPAVPLSYPLPVKGPVWSRRVEAWKEACEKQEGLSFTTKGNELINLLLGKQKKPRGGQSTC